MQDGLWTAVLAPGATIFLAAVLSAQARTPRDLTGYLPADTPLVVDLADGAACIAELRQAMSPLPSGLPWSLRLGWLALPWATMGATGLGLNALAKTVAPHQVALALFPGREPFPVLLSRIDAPAVVRPVLERLRGSVGKLHFAFRRNVLLVTGEAKQLRTVQAFLESDQPRLLGQAGYRAGRAELQPGRGIRFYADLAGLRKLAGNRELWSRLDPAAKVFVGPVLRPLDRARRIDGHLSVSAAGLRIEGRVDAGLAGDPRRVGRLVAAGIAGRTMPPRPAGTVAELSLDRNFGVVLSDPEAWFGADGSLGVKQFLSTADQLLGGGVSMEADLIPNLTMPAHLFVTETTPDPDADAPRMKLPAFTLVVGVRAQHKRIARMLGRSFGTITAIANVERARNKQSVIRTRNGTEGGYRFQRIEFADWNGPGDPPTENGLTPTLLFAHGRCILSSTTDGALRMAQALAVRVGDAASRAEQLVSTVGDALWVDGPGLAEWVRRNAALVAIDRVLDEGESPAEAAQFVNNLAAVLRALRLRGAVVPDVAETRFDFELRRLRGEDRGPR